MIAPAAQHALTALVVGAAAVATGTFSAFFAAPLVCLLAAQALSFRRDPERSFERRSIGLAIGVFCFAGVPLLFGHPFWAVMVACSGGALAARAAQLSLARNAESAGAHPGRVDPRLHAGVALDEALRLVVELRSSLGISPPYAEIAAEARVAADRNEEEGWYARPERAYVIPPPLEKVRRQQQTLRGLGPVDVWRFASEFEPQDPEIRDAYLAERPNRTVQAVMLRHGGAPRPTLIYCHGYGLGNPSLDARMAGARRLHRELGIDIALFTLPLHGSRAVSRVSGAGVLDGQPLVTNAAIGQAVWDLRRLTGHLRAAGAPSVGVYGTSLGGYVASVFASVDERLASVIAMNVPTSLDRLFWHQMPPNAIARARAAGLTEPVLARAWSRHALLRMRPQVAHRRRLVIGGLADRVVEPVHTRELWEHWGRPALHWYPGTHTLWLGLEPLRGAVDQHLRETLLSLD